MKGLLFCFSNHHGNPPKFILSIKPLASDIEGFCFLWDVSSAGRAPGPKPGSQRFKSFRYGNF